MARWRDVSPRRTKCAPTCEFERWWHGSLVGRVTQKNEVRADLRVWILVAWSAVFWLLSHLWDITSMRLLN